jgi:hypothetical protein
VNQQQVVRELAEEIRQNTRLRHRLGMEEGTGSGVLESQEADPSNLYIDTADGQTFAVGVVEVKAEDAQA